MAFGQAAPQFGWRVPAYVVRRNPYHLALNSAMAVRALIPEAVVAKVRELANEVGRP